ncbi:unnamed protein product [Cuscuta epithymum]|uniref:Uncharacterized protein n=1 Tax=Cuscuta epithymum TaxID=186058 RepID=A0AAV0ECJ7_9ASTE|nr:unnamed protein product [Cuscuta epithymum]
MMNNQMALKVEVYQKENVKPLYPTPESLSTYKLSLLDQIAGTFYMPIVFFYAHSAASPPHDYDRLKLSLSKALSLCYPLAGRQKDEFTVVCNDAGADFFRANITNCDLPEVLRHPRLDFLRQLFPREPYPTDFDPSQPLLAVQVNRFRCGGTAVAICLWHALADGSGLLGLLQTWSRFNRGEGPAAATANHNDGSFVVDPTLIFSPGNFDIPALISSEVARQRHVSETYIGKRFVFSKKEIESIKDDMQKIPSSNSRRPTRVESLSAFIWAAVIRATLQVTPNLKTHVLTNAVDLRRRMDPPFPPNCLGNINQITAAIWAADGGPGAITAKSLIGSVREAIIRVNDGYVRKMHEGGGYIRAIMEARKEDPSVSNNKEEEEKRILCISTWFKFECLKVDFGWGKPKWLGPGNNLGDLALLLDAEDGGIEVWVGLPRPIMNHLDQDLDFTSRVAFSQIIWDPSKLPQLLPSRL